MADTHLRLQAINAERCRLSGAGHSLGQGCGGQQMQPTHKILLPCTACSASESANCDLCAEGECIEQGLANRVSAGGWPGAMNFAATCGSNLGSAYLQ
eukprot:6169026-Amphidinium_carterae.1